MQRNNLPYESEGIFLTNVVSHILMAMPVYFLVKRKWIFEATISAFSVFTSFMYHLVQALQQPIFMEELQWHFLDNIGAISGFAVVFTYMAAFKDPEVDAWIKMLLVMFAIVIQIPHPWDVQYTFVPIGLICSMPVFTFMYRYYSTMNNTASITSNSSSSSPFSSSSVAVILPKNATVMQRLHFCYFSVYNGREAAIGFGALGVALFFFSLGLDEAHDPYRVYHGLGWHTFGGVASVYLWRVVKDPVANEYALMLERKHQQVMHGNSNNNTQQKSEESSTMLV